jgi:hypothetical protein
MVTVLENGLIVFKNIWVFIVGDGVGIVWSSLLPHPPVSVDVSRVFSLYSFAIPWQVYWMCNIIHLGSAVLALFIFWVMVQAFRFALDIILFVSSGFLTKEERFVKRNMQWREWLEPSASLNEVKESITTLQARVDVLTKKD